MWASKGTLAALCLIGWPGAAGAEAPLSAIDWLSQSVTTPAALPAPSGTEPPVTGGATPAPITVLPIDGPNLDGIGILPASSTGLPRKLWGTSSTETLTRMLRAERMDTLPAMQALLMTLLLAELAPPADSAGSGALFLARADKLLDLGALDPAMALLSQIDKHQPETFRRWFDVALLLGEEDRACEEMRATPEIAPTFPARVFCLARGGDWNAAALSLRTGAALGHIEADKIELLERFLDPELFEGDGDLPVPERISPLVFRLMEAIGQPLPTATLPPAFAQSDLRANSGWKTRLEAGERLARTGAIDPGRLFALYAERRPAASGGVWDRAAAIQRLDAALDSGGPAAVDLALPEAWSRIEAAELEVPFATVYGARLQGLGLGGRAGTIAFRVGLLSPDYERVAQARKPEDGVEPFLIGIARGNLDGVAPPDQLGGAIKDAFVTGYAPPADLLALVQENRLGEALLRAIEMVTEGAKGDLRQVTGGLGLLRHVGLENAARRAALELALLERRG